MPGNKIGQQTLNAVFKDWFQLNYGADRAPKLGELIEIMNKKFKHTTTKPYKWIDIGFVVEEDTTDDVLDNI